MRSDHVYTGIDTSSILAMSMLHTGFNALILFVWFPIFGFKFILDVLASVGAMLH